MDKYLANLKLSIDLVMYQVLSVIDFLAQTPTTTKLQHLGKYNNTPIWDLVTKNSSD